ncbi:helix-turn-helix domain-containing protein [Micromonospora sp. CPCC 206061]|uniref:helix-turn-helix domain-containing protein n=1 Tax=Micromonospora sp. CPCC 206061 TaxID=3122410 RepID=UPI002FEEEF1A
MDAQHIGIRVRHWRLKRNLSQRALAELAGFSQGYVAQIEAGMKPVDKRSVQVALAGALQVSVADLTGQPYDPQTVEHNLAARAVPAVRAALLSISLGDRRERGPSIEALRGPVATAAGLHNSCQYDGLVPRLPDLILDLYAAGDSAEALQMLTWTTYATTFAAKYLGYADLALLASQQCVQVAERLAEPAWRGVAEFALLHALPPETKDLASRRLRDAISSLEAASRDRPAAEAYGMLHLTAALFAAMRGRNGDAVTHLAEATDVADRSGEGNFAEMWFGPTNTVIWKIGVYAELGDGGRVIELPDVDVGQLGSRNRRATYFADMGRALAQTKRHDREALTYLLRAESIAPQRVRLSPPVREAVGAMLRRAKRTAGGRELQALATRLGTV